MRPGGCSVILTVLLVAMTGAGNAAAGPATDQLRAHVDQVLTALDTPGAGKIQERRATTRRIAEDIFDFTEISQRSLGVHWQARTPAERQEFVALFTDLLERSYVSKIELYSGEKILYVGELGDNEVVTVRTRIQTKQGTEVPVDYRMLRRGDRWRAFDVAIEGVSLVGNYRTQFNKIVQTSSYTELVKRLRAKLDEPEPAAAGRGGRPAGAAAVGTGAGRPRPDRPQSP
jgi:phospholipid transport system substrate-binding protein